MPERLTHYEILEVKRSATAEEIKGAYRQRAARGPFRHPDKGGTATGFAALQAAYEELSDPRRREEYDLTLQVEASAQAAGEAGVRLAEHATKRGEQLAHDLVDGLFAFGRRKIRERLGVK